MHYVPETGFNIVLAGRWNVFIFSPSWIKENLLEAEGDGEQLSISVPVADPIAPHRISFGSVFLFPSSQGIELRPTEPTEDAIRRTCNVARRILELLSHTPIVAAGINFRFVTNNEAVSLTNLFSFSDAMDIPAEKFPLKQATVARSFSFEEHTLNLNISQIGAEILIEFNFHYESHSAENLRNQLIYEEVERMRILAIDFIDTTYKQSLDQ